MPSSRYEQVIEALKTACASVQIGTPARQKYFARRGPILWQHHQWDKNPYAISIQETENSLDDLAFNECVFRLEMMTQIPSGYTSADDAIIYQMRQDAVAILNALRASITSPGNNTIVDVQQPRAALTYDLILGCQGFTVTFIVSYTS